MTRGSDALRVALVGGPMYDPLYEEIASFSRDTGVAVEIVAQLTHPELNAFVTHAFEAHLPLDLISTHSKYAPSQAAWLSPLEDLLPAETIGDLLPRPAELSRIGGRLLQVPRNLDIRLLHYRTDLIASPPQTWTDLIETASGMDGVYGFLFPGRDSGLFGMFYELLAGAGGALFDEDLHPAFDSDAGRWAVERIVELHLTRRVTPRQLARWHYDEISAAFRAGDAAMVTDWPGSYHLYGDPATSRVVERTGLERLPAGPAGFRAAYAGCHSFAIPRATRRRDLAGALLRHLTRVEAQFAEASRGAIPCRTRALDRIRASTAGHAEDGPRWQLLAEMERSMIVPPRFAAYPRCEDAIWRSVQRAMLGGCPPAEAVRNAAADVRAIVTAHDATGIRDLA